MCPERAGLGRGAALATALALGCSGPARDERTLGDDLGTFNVAATETENTCGAGALGSSESFAFEVELARSYTELFWDGRVGGAVDASLAFEFKADVRVELRAPRAAQPGCAIVRNDEVFGVLEAAPGGAVTGFAASMTYAFEPEPDAECSLTDLESSGLPVVPCRMEYALAAERIRTPDL